MEVALGLLRAALASPSNVQQRAEPAHSLADHLDTPQARDALENAARPG